MNSVFESGVSKKRVIIASVLRLTMPCYVIASSY